MDNTTTRIVNAPAAAVSAAISIALSFAAPPVHAQAVWRCGSTYQQAPCTGGQAVQVADPRTAQERSTHLDDVARTSRQADAMEQSRLKAEEKAPPAQVMPETPAAPPSADPEPKVNRAFFTARGPKPPKAAKKAKTKAKKTAVIPDLIRDPLLA